MRLRDIPNIISMARIALVAPIILLLLDKHFAAALGLFMLAGASDALDGYLAKKYGWQSRLGTILDPLADKLLLVSTYLALGWLALLPVWLVIAVIARDLVVVLGAVAYHFLLGRYEMAPTLASKMNTAAQIILVLVIIGSSVMASPLLWLHESLVYIVLVTTLISGADYVWTWGTRAYRARLGGQDK